MALKTYPFKESSRKVPRSMNYVIRKAKEMILAVSKLYGHQGYECSIELFEIEEHRQTILWLKVNCRKGAGKSQWEAIQEDMEDCPRAILSNIPGGICLPYERQDKTGKVHQGYFRVIFSGFSFQALDQETSVRLASFLAPMIEVTKPDFFQINDTVMLTEPFLAYIAYKLEIADIMWQHSRYNKDKSDDLPRIEFSEFDIDLAEDD